MSITRISTLLAAAVVAGAAPLHAQSRVTILGGYSNSEFVVPTPGGEILTPVTGFVPGIGLTLGVSDRVGITAEALYVRKGFTFDAKDLETGISTHYSLDIRYAEFPLLLTARYPVGKAQLVVLGGGTLGLRVQCAADIDQSNGTRDDTDCIDTDRGVIVPATNLALTAGFGLAWHRFSLTGQYEMTGNTVPGFSPGSQRQERTLILMLGIDLLKSRDR